MSDEKYTLHVEDDIVTVLLAGEPVTSWSPKVRTYPYQEGDVIHLAMSVFISADEKVINYNGVNYVPQKVENLQPPLDKYKVGEDVEVLKNGDWLPGRISSKQAGVVNVDTERGPVGIGGHLRIRKVQSNG